MAIYPNTENAKNRIAHTKEHRDSDINDGAILRRLNFINTNSGSPTGCIRNLESFSTASAIAAWYETGSLKDFKNWMYIRSKLEYIRFNEPYNEPSWGRGYENAALNGMFYLVSDHPNLISWYSTIDTVFPDKYTDNPKYFDFWTKQFFIALRGEWDSLTERCERIITAPPTGSREKKFMLDHSFYLALAKDDVTKMEDVISKLVTPKLISNRNSIEGGFSQDLICTPAIIYSKLAWRNGYEVVVDSPYIPKEWLPIKPLETYTDPFDFMTKFAI